MFAGQSMIICKRNVKELNTLFQTLQQELQRAATEFQLFHLHHIMLVRSHYKVLHWCWAVMAGQWKFQGGGEGVTSPKLDSTEGWGKGKNKKPSIVGGGGMDILPEPHSRLMFEQLSVGPPMSMVTLLAPTSDRYQVSLHNFNTQTKIVVSGY